MLWHNHEYFLLQLFIWSQRLMLKSVFLKVAGGCWKTYPSLHLCQLPSQADLRPPEELCSSFTFLQPNSKWVCGEKNDMVHFSSLVGFSCLFCTLECAQLSLLETVFQSILWGSQFSFTVMLVSVAVEWSYAYILYLTHFSDSFPESLQGVWVGSPVLSGRFLLELSVLHGSVLIWLKCNLPILFPSLSHA